MVRSEKNSSRLLDFLVVCPIKYLKLLNLLKVTKAADVEAQPKQGPNNWNMLKT